MSQTPESTIAPTPAEAAPVGGEALLAAFLESVADCAYLKNLDGYYLAVSRSAAAFVGKTPAEMVGRNDFELFSVEVARRLAEEDRAVLASGASLTFDEEIRNHAGQPVCLQTVKSVCRDAAGRAIGLTGVSRDVGERKNLESTLRQRERELLEAQRIANIGTWRWERASDTVTWSEEIYRIFGVDRSYKPSGYAELMRLGGTETRRRFVAAFDRAVRFGTPYSNDLEITTPAGEVRWMIARGEVEAWEDGPEGRRVASLRGTVQDITERKELEIALQRRERDLTEAHRIAGLGTWRYDCVTGETTWSEEVYRIYGMDPAKPPMRYTEFRKRKHHSANDIEFMAAFERLLATGEPYEMDIEVRLADGTTRWTASRGEVDQWVDGTVASVRGTVHEITERKRHEEQLALSENRYRSLAYASSQIVWVSDATGMQRDTLPAWQAFTGQTDEQILGLNWADAIHPEDRERSVDLWRQSIATGVPHVVEQRLRRHDGEYRHMRVHAVPVRDSAGTIVEWVGTHTDITEQKQAEEEMLQARQRLEDVLESITDGLCMLDKDWRYVYYNEHGARVAGLKPSDIVGKQLGDIYASNKTNAFGQAYRRAAETGQTIHFEEFYGAPLHKWIECNCYPSAHGLTVYFRDVTERRRTEDALRESEARYRKLFESNLMGICRPDRFGGFHEGNDELLRLTGYTRQDLEAGLVRWDRMTPPEYAAVDAEHIAEAAERGSCTPYEKEYIRKDGSRVPILCGYALLEGSQDEYIGFVLDLTRQREAEAALREREQRFRLLSDSLPELVWMSDAGGSLTYLNQRFLDYCGIPPEEMVGFDWQKLLHPEESASVNEMWANAVATGTPYLKELRMRRYDGEFRYFLARSLPMRNDEGAVERWVGSCTDVHDQRLAEEALRRSEKLAATGRLAASIAHEINNPLSSVVNALYLALQDDGLAAETREFLVMAQQELARVSHITTQTLRFHRQSKAASWADLSDIVQSVLELFRTRLMSRRIVVQSEFEADTRICCFEDELRQVFANLVSNSLDATPDGGRLRIRIRKALSGEGPGVRVTVGDTGSGIPAAIQRRIFEPFFSTKDATGIGLGLWVSEGIIRKHAGRLRLRSSVSPEAHGTVFSIFFPQDGVGQGGAERAAQAGGLQSATVQ